MARQAGQRGRRPARHIPDLALARFRTVHEVEPAPPSADVSHSITAWGMLGNDQQGCCGPAATQHYRMAKAGSTGLLLFGGNPATGGHGPAGTPLGAYIGQHVDGATDPQATAYTLDLYHAYGRAQGEPGDNPDQGVDNATWLRWLFDQGLIEGFAQLDPANPDEIRRAMIDFGGVLVGIALADDAEARFEAQPPQPWDITGTDPIDPNAGHDVLLVAYDEQGETVITWGAEQRCTINFAQAQVAAHDLDAWVIISTEDADRAGIDLAALQSTIRGLSGTLDGAAPAPAPAASSELHELHPEVAGKLEDLFARFKAEAHSIVVDALGAAEKL